MKLVERSELLALGAYEGIRDRFRARMIEQKFEAKRPANSRHGHKGRPYSFG